MEVKDIFRNIGKVVMYTPRGDKVRIIGSGRENGERTGRVTAIVQYVDNRFGTPVTRCYQYLPELLELIPEEQPILLKNGDNVIVFFECGHIFKLRVADLELNANSMSHRQNRNHCGLVGESFATFNKSRVPRQLMVSDLKRMIEVDWEYFPVHGKVTKLVIAD